MREVQRLVERKERVQKNIESDCVNEFCLLDGRFCFQPFSKKLCLSYDS